MSYIQIVDYDLYKKQLISRNLPYIDYQVNVLDVLSPHDNIDVGEGVLLQHFKDFSSFIGDPSNKRQLTALVALAYMYFEILETGDSLIALPYDHLYVNGHEFFSSSDEELIDAIIKYARIDLA